MPSISNSQTSSQNAKFGVWGTQKRRSGSHACTMKSTLCSLQCAHCQTFRGSQWIRSMTLIQSDLIVAEKHFNQRVHAYKKTYSFFEGLLYQIASSSLDAICTNTVYKSMAITLTRGRPDKKQKKERLATRKERINEFNSRKGFHCFFMQQVQKVK